jgi:serine protease Do
MHNTNRSTLASLVLSSAIACKMPMQSAPVVISVRQLLCALLLTALSGLAGLSGFYAAPSHAADLAQTIARIKPSVVGVGTFIKTRSPSFQLVGTGFVVADGLHVITNAHNYAKPLDSEKLETPMVLLYNGGEPQPREARVLAISREHDLALLKISGAPVPAMPIGDSASVREGQALAFTGFPIGLVLGMHPATHRGIVAAIVPVALPGVTARTLDERAISRIRDSSYRVFQLDGTAYPGNSGSPLYDPEDGTVYGVINAVFIQGTRESAIGRPSGITYAIPSRFIRELLQREKITGF